MNDTNKNPMDDFSLDSLDLASLGNGNVKSHDVEINLNDFDLDVLMDTTNQQPTPQTTSNANNSVDFEFDLGEILKQNPTTDTAVSQPAELSTPTSDAKADGVEEMEDISLDELISPEVATAGAVATGAVASSLMQDDKSAPAKPAKKGFFGKKDSGVEKPKKEKKPLFGGKSANNKNNGNSPQKPNNKQSKNIIYALLAVVALGGVAWFMTSSNQEEPAPEPTPVVVPETQPETVASATSDVTSDVASTTTDSAEESVASVASVTNTIIASVPMDTETVEPASTPAITTTKPVVTAEEILSAEKPKDPSIAQEELDRLADQASQLAEQEKMIEEQLRMMNELSSKKEERIKLLEQQIAQLEQQKAQEKLDKSN